MVVSFHFFLIHYFVSLFPGEIGGFQREESQDVIRDVDWSTRNVMLGYDVAGSTLVNLNCPEFWKAWIVELWCSDQIAMLLDSGGQVVETIICPSSVLEVRFLYSDSAFHHTLTSIT